jgi:hypothetical protein
VAVSVASASQRESAPNLWDFVPPPEPDTLAANPLFQPGSEMSSPCLSVLSTKEALRPLCSRQAQDPLAGSIQIGISQHVRLTHSRLILMPRPGGLAPTKEFRGGGVSASLSRCRAFSS